MSEATEASLVASREGAAGAIQMNRPKALNALNQDMIRGFAAAIRDWRHDPTVKLVLLEGAGGRAFCAGGDVRAVRASAVAGDRAAVEAFFSEEYAVNAGIADFGKPWVSLIDGVCMGGGIGVSVHGTHRIVTNHAMFAMPETAIALFPDVGTTFVLPRLPGALGMWLALTGERLNGADALHAGLATHFTTREALPALRAALIAGDMGATLQLCGPAPEASFAPQRAAIDRCFGAGSIPAIIAALEAEDTDWAREQLGILHHASPTSLFVTHELLTRGAKRDLAGCLAMELALTRVVVNDHPDFREGVRAVLVDKDHKPQWQPASIAAIDKAAIRAMFKA
ncbi:MAG: enoyl-CoA hydratase/isomerase family protein [Alphaproteobacteria bacterium]|nr:enoyl-CoA hydratase/isomerase family protein [Alphaproteobacteria bacterium]